MLKPTPCIKMVAPLLQKRKRIAFQTTSPHEMCTILQNAEQQHTVRNSVSLGYSAVLGDAINFAEPNPTLTTSL